MTACDLDSAVPDWVIDHPEALPLLEAWGIDVHCGGKSLRYACEQRGLVAEDVLRQLLLRIGELRPLLVSIQVGQPQTYGCAEATDPHDQLWTTGFFKRAVSGPVWLGQTQLEGDGQADRENHGGIDKAVLMYAAAHYDDWRRELNLEELPFGAFGENFTVDTLTETDVCIGDTWGIGDAAVVQVSQPRQPCWKLNRRWRSKTLVARVLQSGRSGWYVRVLTPGMVEAGQRLTLLDRPFPTWSVSRANRVMHFERYDRRATAELAALPLLSTTWRDELAQREARDATDSDNTHQDAGT
jgi:MOSC domain-containing protein YiiM